MHVYINYTATTLSSQKADNTGIRIEYIQSFNIVFPTYTQEQKIL